MISEHEILENGNKQQRCQVVRWVRTFPFSFLSKREYIIGRRMWRSPDGCLYGITKVSIFSHRLPWQLVPFLGRLCSMCTLVGRWPSLQALDECTPCSGVMAGVWQSKPACHAVSVFMRLVGSAQL